MTMMISASGVLLRASKSESMHGNGSRGHSLALLYDHLKEVKERHERGESKEVLDEFFEIWTEFDAPSVIKEASQ